MSSRLLAAGVALSVLLIGAVGFGALRLYKSSPSQKSGYSVELKELRDQFNADRGTVRLLMLLSPT
jgi:hypothetical protein